MIKKMLSVLVILSFMCFSTAYAHDGEDDYGGDNGTGVAILAAAAVATVAFLIATSDSHGQHGTYRGHNGNDKHGGYGKHYGNGGRDGYDGHDRYDGRGRPYDGHRPSPRS